MARQLNINVDNLVSATACYCAAPEWQRSRLSGNGRGDDEIVSA